MDSTQKIASAHSFAYYSGVREHRKPYLWTPKNPTLKAAASAPPPRGPMGALDSWQGERKEGNWRLLSRHYLLPHPRGSNYSHIADKETETRKGEETCPRSHSWRGSQDLSRGCLISKPRPFPGGQMPRVCLCREGAGRRRLGVASLRLSARNVDRSVPAASHALSLLPGMLGSNLLPPPILCPPGIWALSLDQVTSNCVFPRGTAHPEPQSDGALDNC